MKLSLKKALSGHKRKIGDLKQSGEMKVFEGKRHLSLQQYVTLIEYSLKNNTDFNLSSYSHCYITMCWNLMARTNNVALLKYAHFEWENDALSITLPKHKGDQVDYYK